MSQPARVSMKILKDIDQGAFDELRRRINAGKHVVRVGVPSGATEADGTALTLVAAVHEFGAPSVGIPERPFLRAAIERNRLNYVRLNRINLVKMLRGQTTVEDALGRLGEMAKGDVQTEIRNGDFVALKPATIAARRRARGDSYNNAIQRSVAQKQNDGGEAGPIDRPLIDTGQLRQSIAWEIE